MAPPNHPGSNTRASSVSTTIPEVSTVPGPSIDPTKTRDWLHPTPSQMESMTSGEVILMHNQTVLTGMLQKVLKNQDSMAAQLRRLSRGRSQTAEGSVVIDDDEDVSSMLEQHNNLIQDAYKDWISSGHTARVTRTQTLRKEVLEFFKTFLVGAVEQGSPLQEILLNKVSDTALDDYYLKLGRAFKGNSTGELRRGKDKGKGGKSGKDKEDQQATGLGKRKATAALETQDLPSSQSDRETRSQKRAREGSL